jgi:hypothetical protein
MTDASTAAQPPAPLINWDTDPTEDSQISDIVDRFLALIGRNDDLEQRLTHRMNLTACHLNGCSLDLQKLLEGSDFLLSHELLGIDRNIDRNTGRLDTDRFLPRCALPQTPTENA